MRWASSCTSCPLARGSGQRSSARRPASPVTACSPTPRTRCTTRWGCTAAWASPSCPWPRPSPSKNAWTRLEPATCRTSCRAGSPGSRPSWSRACCRAACSCSRETARCSRTTTQQRRTTRTWGSCWVWRENWRKLTAAVRPASCPKRGASRRQVPHGRWCKLPQARGQ